MKSPEHFCREILPEVSRTFALNIPVLPEPLDLAVTVAYLLCRIADTLEDEATGNTALRAEHFAELSALVALPEDWPVRATRFAAAARDCLREEAPSAEARLLASTPLVLQALAAQPAWSHVHVHRCVASMTAGMSQMMLQLGGERAPLGLPDLSATLDYCYYVAGTVGEMLTGLFCEYSPLAAARGGELLPRAAAFGRVLQLTNILKDVREDLDRGACWLPRDRMAAHGVSPETLLQPERRAQAVALLDEMVDTAQREADTALEYTLTLPASQDGLRLFCLWPLFFAVLTLRSLRSNPNVFEPAPVKIGRELVQRVMVQTRERVLEDAALRTLYAQCCAGAWGGGEERPA